MASFCERNVWTGPFCIGLPQLFVIVDHVEWENVLTRLHLCLTGIIFEVVKKMGGLMFFRVDFPEKMIHLNASLIHDTVFSSWCNWGKPALVWRVRPSTYLYSISEHKCLVGVRVL